VTVAFLVFCSFYRMWGWAESREDLVTGGQPETQKITSRCGYGSRTMEVQANLE